MNVKTIITSQLDALGLGKFNNLADDIAKEIEADVEAKIRKMVAPGFDRVCRRVRKTVPKSNQGNHEKQ